MSTTIILPSTQPQYGHLLHTNNNSSTYPYYHHHHRQQHHHQQQEKPKQRHRPNRRPNRSRTGGNSIFNRLWNRIMMTKSRTNENDQEEEEEKNKVGITVFNSNAVTRRGRKRLSLCESPDFAEGVFFKVGGVGPSSQVSECNFPSSRTATTTMTTTTTAFNQDDNNESSPSRIMMIKRGSNHSDTTTTTTTTVNSSTTPTITPSTSWRSTEKSSFLTRQPLIVQDVDRLNVEPPITDEAAALGLIMQRSRTLPGTWYFSSNHIMVNQERTKRCIAPLKRLAELDALARQQAERMAHAQRLFHSNPQELAAAFDTRPSRRMGENVAVGTCIRTIHDQMMQTPSDKNNILDRRYCHFGMATTKDPITNQLYLCQVFRG